MIPTELCKYAADEVARLLDPLNVKVSMTISAPIQWRGGDLKALLKSSTKSLTDPTNRRDITLADQTGKTFGATLRTKVAPQLNLSLDTSQHGGGLHASACDATHLAARAFAGVAEVRGTCLAMVMVDIQSAFAVILRQLAMPMTDREGHLQKVLESHGFTPDEIADIADPELTLHEWRNTSPHMFYLRAAMHDSVWAAFDHTQAVMTPATGTQAGVPLADVVAMATISRVTRKVARRLRDEHLITEFDSEAAHIYFGLPTRGLTLDSSYITELGIIDDAAYPILSNADNIVQDTAKAMGIIYDTYAQHNLTLNMAPNKTAVILTLHSKNTRELQAKQITEIPFVTRWGTMHVPLVEQYKHLG